MNTLIKSTYCLLLAALLLAPIRTQAQSLPAHNAATPELALNYSWLHSNAPPGGCGCFSLNGGAASFALPLRSGRIALAAEVSDGYTSNVLNTGKSLNLSTYSAGLRYSPRAGRSGLSPFAQVLAGVAHVTGPLVSGSSSTTTNAGAAFAATFGGGLDLRLNRHIALRLIQAEYLLTTFDNSADNHQNNVQLEAGLVFHFHAR